MATIPSSAEVLNWMQSLSNWGRWDGRNLYEFMLMLGPLVLRNVTGNPINPIAMF